MLAYVFWHVPRPGIGARAYESAHREFHEVLWKTRIDGLVGLRVYRLASIPWLDGNAGYEDWHLLEGSADLDLLNAAAISQARQGPHDRIAAMAGDGTAGLYGLRRGALNDLFHAHWLSKPADMSYRDFETGLQPQVEAGACLWGRRMTLGPTPEFCLHASAKPSPPHAVHSIARVPVLKHSLGDNAGSPI